MHVARITPERLDEAAALVERTGAAIDLAAELARPWALAWAARADAAGPAVAFAVAWAVADELHVLQVVTEGPHRRTGAGTALVRAMVDHAAATRCRLVLLEVRRSNHAAIRLYRAQGLAAIGVRRGYYSDGEDAIEMMLTLDPATGERRPTEGAIALGGSP